MVAQSAVWLWLECPFSRALPALAALATSAGACTAAPKAAGATLAGRCRGHLRVPIFAASVRRRSESGLAFDQLGVDARRDRVDFRMPLFDGRLALAPPLRVSDRFLSRSGAMAHASRTSRRAKSHAGCNRDQCRAAQRRRDSRSSTRQCHRSRRRSDWNRRSVQWRALAPGDADGLTFPRRALRV